MQDSDRPTPKSPTKALVAAAAAQAIQPSSPRFFFTSAAASAPSGTSHRRIAIAVDLSDESAYAVKWAVQNYLRPGDAVILLHVCCTSVLYGADWGSIDHSPLAEPQSEESQQKLENDFDTFTSIKAHDLAQPLVDAHIPFKVHIVKDHDMKERLCLEIERLTLSAVIMGSRGFGASRRSSKGGLGSVSDYCVHHCACPVVVVRFPDDGNGGHGESEEPEKAKWDKETELHPAPELHSAPEDEQEYHDADDEHKDSIQSGDKFMLGEWNMWPSLNSKSKISGSSLNKFNFITQTFILLKQGEWNISWAITIVSQIY